MAQKFLSSLNLNNLASDPSSALAGDIYYNTVSNAVKFYNGTAWTAVGAGSGSGTVTSIIAGTGLTGGTITSSGTIAIDTAVVPQLASANTFTTTQTITPATGVTGVSINGATSSTGLSIKAAATPGTFIDYRDNSNNSVGSVGSDGTHFIKQIRNVGGSVSRAVFSDASAAVIVNAANTNYVGLAVRGFSSGQSSDIVQYQSSSASVLGGVNAAGQKYIGSSSIYSSSSFAHSAASAPSSSVATYTLSTPLGSHPFVVGSTVTITGFTPSYFNGTFPITAIGGVAGSWTYTVYNIFFTFTASGTSTVQGVARPSGMLGVQSPNPYVVPVVVRGASSQVSSLQEWQTSTGTAVASLGASGNLTLNNSFSSAQSVSGLTFNSQAQSTEVSNIRWNAAASNTNNVGGMVITGGYNTNTVGVIVKASGGSAANSAVFGATANGTTSVTYTSGISNRVVPGAVVTISNIVSAGNPGATAGIGFNLTNATVTAASPTQFTVTAPSALTDTYTSGGAATSVSGIADITQWQTAQGTTLAKVDYLGRLTATGIIKSGGTSVEFLKADGSVDSSTTLFITSSAEITPLDNLKLEFDSRESRFIPKYRGEQVYIGNPHRVEISVNGVQQPLDFPEYVWGTPFMGDGFAIDSDGFIAFSEVPPAGATFTGKIVAGSPTSTLDNRYPFKAADILLGAY